MIAMYYCFLMTIVPYNNVDIKAEPEEKFGEGVWELSILCTFPINLKPF